MTHCLRVIISIYFSSDSPVSAIIDSSPVVYLHEIQHPSLHKLIVFQILQHGILFIDLLFLPMLDHPFRHLFLVVIFQNLLVVELAVPFVLFLDFDGLLLFADDAVEPSM